jgi:hypothetical protein
LFDRDIVIDIKIIATLQTNVTALKAWLAGINDLKTRETFRMFLEDCKGVLTAMKSQHDLQLGTIRKMKKKWQQQTASAGSAEEKDSTSKSTPPISSAPDAAVQA